MRRSVTRALQQHLLRRHCSTAPQAVQQQAVQVSIMLPSLPIQLYQCQLPHAVLTWILLYLGRRFMLLPARRPTAVPAAVAVAAPVAAATRMLSTAYQR